MLQVHGKPTSINVRKVLWLCEELALPYQLHAEVEPHSAALLALNPNGQVPVLVDGAFTLWESNSICRYLAMREGREDLLPRDAQARARVEQWMDWQATDLNTAWRYAFMARVRRHPDYTDAAASAASLGRWNQLMGLLDQQLGAGGDFVTGAAFTLADIVLGLSTQRWRMTPGERPSLPAVEAWFARLDARPGFRRFGNNGVP